MSLRSVRARLIADEATTGDIRFVEVYGHVISTEFSKVEDDEDVLRKLEANPHIEVKEAGPGRTSKPADGASE